MHARPLQSPASFSVSSPPSDRVPRRFHPTGQPPRRSRSPMLDAGAHVRVRPRFSSVVGSTYYDYYYNGRRQNGRFLLGECYRQGPTRRGENISATTRIRSRSEFWISRLCGPARALACFGLRLAVRLSVCLSCLPRDLARLL